MNDNRKKMGRPGIWLGEKIVLMQYKCPQTLKFLIDEKVKGFNDIGIDMNRSKLQRILIERGLTNEVTNLINEHLSKRNYLGAEK
jgi:hypothetical protein